MHCFTLTAVRYLSTCSATLSYCFFSIMIPKPCYTSEMDLSIVQSWLTHSSFIGVDHDLTTWMSGWSWTALVANGKKWIVDSRVKNNVSSPIYCGKYEIGQQMLWSEFLDISLFCFFVCWWVLQIVLLIYHCVFLIWLLVFLNILWYYLVYGLFSDAPIFVFS